MTLHAGQRLSLLDANGEVFGTVEVEDDSSGLVQGRFYQQPAFEKVKQTFLDWEEAVNQQALGVVDRLDRTIAGLGLSLVDAEHSTAMPIHDVQIWSDGKMSCQGSAPVGASVNGSGSQGSARS